MDVFFDMFFTYADSSFVPPLIYAFMGSSRDIAIGPVAVVSLLLGTMLQNELDPTKNKEEYLRLAFTATFFAGITQATLGFFRYSGTFFHKFQKKSKLKMLTNLQLYIGHLTSISEVSFKGLKVSVVCSTDKVV